MGKTSTIAELSLELQIEATVSREFGAEDLRVLLLSFNPKVKDIDITAALSEDDRKHLEAQIIADYEAPDESETWEPLRLENPNGRSA